LTATSLATDVQRSVHAGGATGHAATQVWRPWMALATQSSSPPPCSRHAWYASSACAPHVWMQDEEECFLHDPEQVFGAAHYEALRLIRDRISLDYFGIDCGLDPDGNLIVFEVNASMLVHDDNAEFPYKDPFVRVIKTAFNAMLRSPEMSQGLMDLYLYFRYKTALPRPLVELAILVTSREWSAPFEWYMHYPIGLTEGLSAGMLSGLREGKRRRLIRMTKDQVAGRTGPVRQIRYRDQVVSPLALELGCRKLLRRAQRAIAVVVSSGVYARDLRGTVEEHVLRQHEWEIAVALREITELLLDLVSSAGGGTVGPMTATVLVSQNRAISMARDATTARVLGLELLAGHVAAAEAARRDWEGAHQAAAKNDKYLDLVARTAADQHANAEITGIAEQAAEAGQALRETLQQATLAAEALALPESG